MATGSPYLTPLQRLRIRLILLATLTFFVMTVLAGPLRMYLSMVGLAPLIYVPNLLMLIATIWQLLAEPHERGFCAMRLISLLVVGYAVLIGLLYLPLVQVAMGIYVLLPFWFMLACGPELVRRWAAVQRYIPMFFFLVAGGVIANQFFEYPWEGFGYSVGDLDVEGSRQWYANGGVKRLAGFSRASFDAAVQVQVLAILYVVTTRSAWLRLIIWTLSVFAIYPTNSKGILLVWLVLTPIVLLRERLPESPQRAMPAVIGVLGLTLPLSTLVFSFNSQFSNPTLANLTFSFYDRLNYMWPEAWHLLREYGHLHMGRGVGSVGTAQTYFEPSLFNAGDNVFMYWLVIFGWAAIPGFLFLLLRGLRLRPQRSVLELRIFCLLIAVLVYGSMSNVVENAVFAMTAGLVVRMLASSNSFETERSARSSNVEGVPAHASC